MPLSVSELYAVLLRDRGVRMGAVGDQAEDLGRLGVLEELAWLAGSFSGPAPELFVPAPGTAVVGAHPTWAVELRATSVLLLAGRDVLREWRRDSLPEDWFAAALRRGLVGILLSPDLPDPTSLPGRLEEVLSSSEVFVASLPVRLAALPSTAGFLAEQLWAEERSSVSRVVWDGLSSPSPTPVALPTSPLPEGYVPSFRNLFEAGVPLDDVLEDTCYLDQTPDGLLHFSDDCAGRPHDSIRATVREILSTGCPSCSPNADTPISDWEAGPVRRELESALRAVRLNDHLQVLLTSIKRLPSAPAPPSGFSPVPVGDGPALGLEIIELERAARKSGAAWSREGRDLPVFVEVVRRCREALEALSRSLRERGDPTVERAILLTRFTPAALSHSGDPVLHGRLAEAFSSLLTGGSDPLGHVQEVTRYTGASHQAVQDAFTRWLVELDRGRLTLSGRPCLLGIKMDSGWPELPVLRLAALRWGRIRREESDLNLFVVPLPVVHVLEAVSQDGAELVDHLWPGEDSENLALTFRRMSKHALRYSFKETLQEARITEGRLDPSAPVKWRPLEAAAHQGSSAQYEGRRR